MILQKRVIENSDFDRAWNISRDYQQSVTPMNSDDIQVRRTPAGTTYHIVKKAAVEDSITYTPYDISASYQNGTIVWVDPDINYGVPYQASGSIPLCAGAHMCVIDVPAIANRTNGNLCYPFYPLIPSSSMVTVSGSTYNQNYFNPITPLFPQPVCVNNVMMGTAFVCSIISGSSFDLTLLPYTGSA